MDLTTTKKIKRRVINIQPDQTQERTNCSIELVNWFQNRDLTNVKFKIESFYLNNSTIPVFIPKWQESFPPANFQKNKDATGTVTNINDTFSGTSIDYYINVRSTVGGDDTTIFIRNIPAYSEEPNLAPGTHPSKPFSQYSNRFFWYYNTSKFCELITSHINQVLISLGKTYVCDIIRTGTGYGLYMPQTFDTDGLELQFSDTLIQLFQFRSIESSNSTYLRTIIFNTQIRTYSTVPALFVASNYIPDTWFPFDRLLFRTSFPIESESFYNNSNYISENYQNIMLSYKLVNSNPDAIYNFFNSDIPPDSSWVSLINSNSGDNARFDLLLRLRLTKDTIPYTIGKNEDAIFTTVEIDTIPPY